MLFPCQQKLNGRNLIQIENVTQQQSLLDEVLGESGGPGEARDDQTSLGSLLDPLPVGDVLRLSGGKNIKHEYFLHISVSAW